MNALCLVRLFAMGIEGWFAENADIDRLMKVFDLKEPEQSVYAVADGEEEWLTAAAHVLTTKKRAEAISILRLREENLHRFGITVDPGQLGTTGVTWVDYRHRNLKATAGQFRDLVRCAAEECSRGYDWVRRIEKPYVERTLRRLCAEPGCRCPPHVKHIARWALKETDSRNLDLCQIRLDTDVPEWAKDLREKVQLELERRTRLCNTVPLSCMSLLGPFRVFSAGCFQLFVRRSPGSWHRPSRFDRMQKEQAHRNKSSSALYEERGEEDRAK